MKRSGFRDKRTKGKLRKLRGKDGGWSNMKTTLQR